MNNSSKKKAYVNYSVHCPKSVRSNLLTFIEASYQIKEKDLPPSSWHLLAHILNNSTLKQYREEFEDRLAYIIPIPRDIRDSIIGERGGHEKLLYPLSEKGLIYIHPFSIEYKQCYRYEADPKLRREFLDLSTDYYSKVISDNNQEEEETLVSLGTGEKAPSKAKPKSLLSKNKHRLNNIQAEAVTVLEKEVSVNIQLAYEILLPKRNEARLSNDKKTLATIESDLYNLARIQQQGIRYEYQRLIDPSDNKEREFKILVYWQSFDYPHNLGRIYDRKSAYMNISADTKSALRYAYDQGEMQWNYDAVACYPSILKGLAEKYKIDDPLFQDRDIKTRRQEIIEETKLPKALVKPCTNSTIFRAKFPSEKEAQKALDHPLSEMPTIPRMVWDQTLDPKRYFDALDALRPLLKPYKKFIDKTRKAWCEDPENQSGNCKAFINAVGRSFPKLSKYTRDSL